MMGGCFAQDADSQVVGTYWPAHSVRVDHTTLILKEKSSDLLHPFWTEGMRAGGRIENVSWRESDGNGSNILNWGTWEVGIVDAMYLGTTVDTYVGPSLYGVCNQQNPKQLVAFPSEERFFEYAEAYAADNYCTMDSSLGSGRTEMPNWPSKYYSQHMQIRIKGESTSSDIVSCWYCNDVWPRQFYMVQPMCSVAGDKAFFTHGFDILTEL